MTSHFYRIHTSYTIITVSTVAACLFLLLHPVHESRFVEQSSRHLHSIKTRIEHFIYFLTGNKTTDINQRRIRKSRTEFQCMEAFAASVRTMEKLHGIGEASLLELAENRHQLYESRLAFLDNLDKLMAIQAQLRYLTHANL